MSSIQYPYLKSIAQNKASLIFYLFTLIFLFPICIFAQPANDACSNATPLTSGATCTTTSGTLRLSGSNATATAGINAFCGNAGSADVWYSFVAQSAFPTITLKNMGKFNMDNSPRLQIFNTSSCTCRHPKCKLQYLCQR